MTDELAIALLFVCCVILGSLFGQLVAGAIERRWPFEGDDE